MVQGLVRGPEAGWTITNSDITPEETHTGLSIEIGSFGGGAPLLSQLSSCELRCGLHLCSYLSVQKGLLFPTHVKDSVS